MQLNSIRFKTTVLYTGILCFILTSYSAVLFYTVRQNLYRELDNKLRVKASQIANILHAYEQVSEIESEPLNLMAEFLAGERLDERNRKVIDNLWYANVKTLNLENDYISILNTRGRTILHSENYTKQLELLFREQFPFSLNKIIFRNINDKKSNLQAINFPVFHKGKYPLVIQVGTPLDFVISVLNRLLYFIGISIFLILALTSFLGNFFVKSVLTPVMSIAKTADNITYKDLSVRIKKQAADVEIEHLINSFNVMIARLEKSFGHISEFSSHVAHELKTPLAVIRGEIELALEQNRNPEEYEKVMAECLVELDRMNKVINDLLLLARLDYNLGVFRFEKLNLSQFFAEIHEQSKVLALLKNIEVNAKFPKDNIFIKGDRVHLGRLFLNLINNAVKFTPQKGKINISVNVRDKTVYAAVSDTGEGISEGNLPKIFDRFFRVHKDEPDSEFGSGLGLNIALTIAKAHNGSITVKSRLQQGTAFTVTLPMI